MPRQERELPVEVKVLLFAALRDELGLSELTLALEDGPKTVSSVIEALNQVPARFAERGVRAAVNEEFTSFDHELHGGETIAFIPPVSGG